MWYVRGYTKADKVWNETISSDLNIFSINDNIGEKKNKIKISFRYNGTKCTIKENNELSVDRKEIWLDVLRGQIGTDDIT